MGRGVTVGRGGCRPGRLSARVAPGWVLASCMSSGLAS